MAIWYVDYVNGADANTGVSWAQAFKTLNGATAAKGVLANDVVRVAKSPDPTSLGQTATWTDNSKTVTLTTAVTKNVDLCESAWTAANASTPTADSTNFKQGSFSCKVVVPASAANTLYAYHALGSVNDFSGQQQLSFWVRSTVILADNARFRICLCSDTVGAVIVNSANIPAIPTINSWHTVTVDFGANLGNSIQSVALYSGASTMATTTLQIDNIFACKASSAADALTLTSMFGKGGNDPWLCLQSVNGTTLTIDTGNSTNAGAGRNYYGVTETVTIYKRETTKTTPGTTSQQIQILPGIALDWEFGFNVATSTQDGETIYDGQNGVSYAISLPSATVTINKLSLCRYQRGFYFPSPSSGSSISGHTITNLITDSGFQIATACPSLKINYTNIVLCNGNAINQTVLSAGLVANVTNVFGTSGITLNSINGTINVTNLRGNNIGITSNGGLGNVVNGVAMSNNTLGILMNSYDQIVFKNCTIGDASESQFAAAASLAGGRIYFHPYTGGGYKQSSDAMTVLSDATTVHTAGLAWKISPTSTTGRTATYPADLTIGNVYVAANTQVTASAWLYRSNTSLTGQIGVRAGQLAGVGLTATSMTAAANTWQQVQIQFTPTEAGVIQISAWCWDGTNTNTSLWVDDLSVSQV